MFDPVSYYLHLRAQDKTHDEASAHTLQRFGISAAILGGALREAREQMVHDLKLLPDFPVGE